MKVAVLGCGPTGMLAVEAAVRLGIEEIKVLSYKKPSPMYGAQYLQKPIPGFDLPTRMINHSMVGDLLDYRHRIYGENVDGSIWANTSATAIVGDFPGQDIRFLYRELWAKYEHLIVDVGVDHDTVAELVANGWTVLSTIPRKQMCYLKYHCFFEETDIIAAGDAPDLGIKIPIPDFGIEGDFVRYSGSENPWCRISNIFDHVTVEWPVSEGIEQVKKDFPTATLWGKPLKTTCTCWTRTGRVHFLGRYGEWHKGVLAHDAFFKATKVLSVIKYEGEVR